MSLNAPACPGGGAEPVFNLDSPEFLADRDAFYRHLREVAPVYRNPRGGWLLSRHRDITAALEDARLRNVENIRCYADGADMGRTSAGASKSALAQVRQAVARTLSPVKVRPFQARVQQIVDDLLDEAVRAGEVDLVSAFCHPLAAIVFCELFGLPALDRTLFRGWVDGITRGVDIDTRIVLSADVAAQRDDARAEFSEYFRDMIARRRREPADDLLSSLVAIQGQAGSEFTEDELIASCIILLIAGHESTVHFVSNSVHVLLTHPAELRRLGDDPGIAGPAIEELMRYISPAQITVRQAQTDLTVDSHRIAENDLVVLLLGAANRDPDVFDEPERLDLTRTPNPHIAFGHGAHFCLGAALARLEGQLGLTSLARKAPKIRLSGDPVFKPNIGMRGMEKLPVRLR